MGLLNSVSEKILNCINENADNNGRLDLSAVFDLLKSKYRPSMIRAVLSELNEKEYIYLSCDDSFSYGTVLVYPSGMLYLESKRTNNRKYIKQLLMSKTLDIAVSLITAFITSVIVNKHYSGIAAFISKLFG